MYQNNYYTKKYSQSTNLLVDFWIVKIDQGDYIQKGFWSQFMSEKCNVFVFFSKLCAEGIYFLLHKYLSLSLTDF